MPKPEICDKCKAEYVNLLRHELHDLFFNRVQAIKEITGIDYDQITQQHKERAMEVFHMQTRSWIDKKRYGKE